MIHKSEVKNYAGTMEELVVDIGDLKYDALADFLGLLAQKITEDEDKDLARRRIKLANHLHECASKLKFAQSEINKSWKICEPFMPS